MHNNCKPNVISSGLELDGLASGKSLMLNAHPVDFLAPIASHVLAAAAPLKGPPELKRAESEIWLDAVSRYNLSSSS